MIFPAGTINLTRLHTYYEDLGKLHNKLGVSDKDWGYEVTYLIDVEPKDEEAFVNSFALLMEGYGIDDEYWPDIIYICQVPSMQLYTYEEGDPEADNAIRFLMDYQLLKEEELKTRPRLTGEELRVHDPFVIQIKQKSRKDAVSLHYHRSAPVIMKIIYQAFKTSFANTALSTALEAYTDIPTSIELKEMLHEFKLKKVIIKSVQDSAKILTDYFERYIPQKVHSRKKNLIIFELLWLFKTIHHAGLIKRKDMASVRKRTYEPVYALPYKDSECTAIVKELLQKELS